ncbi:MAG: InlB B-repeat-containing protein, partial [Clostridiales bacterium]|nr:InlB B-repeat-containing protein [Clostridiales bacterium]
NVTIENTQITENTTYGGGGVSIHEDVVDLYLYNGNISGNTATVEGGGIYCQSNQIKIKGGIQITGNKLISGTTQIENNVYLRNDTTMQVDNPSSEIVSDDGVTVKYAQIGVTVEDGYSNVVAANDTDYSEYFTADSENERVYYDDADKMLKIVGIYTVAFDIGNGEYYNIVEIERNTAVSEPKGPPSRAGYYFGAWYNGDTPYDFTQPVSSDLTLTAKWLEAGTFGMNITPSKIYIVADNAKAYGAAYKGGKLTDITMQDIVDYAVIELNTIDLDMMNADTISLLIWDENQAPLCRNIIFNIGG